MRVLNAQEELVGCEKGVESEEWESLTEKLEVATRFYERVGRCARICLSVGEGLRGGDGEGEGVGDGGEVGGGVVGVKRGREEGGEGVDEGGLVNGGCGE